MCSIADMTWPAKPYLSRLAARASLSIRFASSAIDPAEKWGTHSPKQHGSAAHASFWLARPLAWLRLPGCEFVSITTAEEMRQAVLKHLPRATLVMKAAAVADYRPRLRAEQKIKRTGPITIELEPTSDILAEVMKASPTRDTRHWICRRN